MTYKFYRMYIPIGEITEAEIDLNDALEFYKVLDVWNRNGDDLWKYWRKL